jgi:hypothetical protein
MTATDAAPHIINAMRVFSLLGIWIFYDWPAVSSSYFLDSDQNNLICGLLNRAHNGVSYVALAFS